MHEKIINIQYIFVCFLTWSLLAFRRQKNLGPRPDRSALRV